MRVGITPAHHERASTAPVLMNKGARAGRRGDLVSVSDAKQVAKSALEHANYGLAAVMTRSGLKQGKDQALEYVSPFLYPRMVCVLQERGRG
jgi:hypothetical protein